MQDSQSTTLIRQALPEEAALLNNLAARSKSYWGYDADFLDACRAEFDLTITLEYVATHPVFILEYKNKIIGFYSLCGQGTEADLDHFFMTPDAIGYGYGKLLWQHTVETAQVLGFSQILIESDPHAEGFYLAMGAQRIGEAPSSVQPGRMLPLLELTSIISP